MAQISGGGKRRIRAYLIRARTTTKAAASTSHSIGGGKITGLNVFVKLSWLLEQDRRRRHMEDDDGEGMIMIALVKTSSMVVGDGQWSVRSKCAWWTRLRRRRRRE